MTEATIQHRIPKERRAFESLLVPFSVECLNAAPNDLDSVIEKGLREVNRFFGSDRVLLWELSDDAQQAHLTHCYAEAGAEPRKNALRSENLPFIFGKLRALENLIISGLRELPGEARTDRHYFERAGIRSFVVIPLAAGGALRGALSLACVRAERAWADEDRSNIQRIGAVLSGALDRKWSHHLLERRMQFETLITDVSARLLMTAAAELDGQIQQALGQVREFFGADRCALLGLRDDHRLCWVTHASYIQGLEPVPGDINLAELFPWSSEQLVVQGKHTNISKIAELPPEAETERASRRAMGIRSFMAVPLLVEGKVASLIVLNAIHAERTWPEEYVPRLRLLGEFFLGALARRADRSKLEEQLRFERLLVEISGRFVNLPVDQVDSQIMDAERRICQLLDLDISAVWQWSEGPPGIYELTHYYSAQDGPQPSMRLGDTDFPWFRQLMIEGRIVPISSLDDMPAEAALDRENCRRLGVKSNLCLPLMVGGKPVGILGLNTTRAEREWPEPIVQRLQLVAQIFTHALARKRADEALHESQVRLEAQLKEIKHLKQKIENENLYLREEASLLFEHGDIVAESKVMKAVLAQVEQVACTDATALITGETGTGKELVARRIHSLSGRKERPMVTVNCASLPPTLIESELFGREKGAYTGAMTRMTGRFEIADGSTLFLDEIAELPLELQGKLLRIIEEGTFERLGSARTIHVNVRIIAATNRELAQEVRRGAFRQDLFYRLNVFPITLPALRDRIQDVAPLVWAFIRQFEKKMGKQIESIPQRSLEALRHYAWPGNIRELRNVIEHAMIVTRDKTLRVSAPTVSGAENPENGGLDLETAERKHILNALHKCGWRVTGPGGAAEALGLKRTTLQSKMKKLGIQRPSN